MIRLRPYKPTDADTIISWTTDEMAHYKWSAGVLGKYPVSKRRFKFVENMMAFTALDDNKEIVGFFTLREPQETPDTLRIGFVIIDPAKRGKGIGKEMIRQAIKYAFDIYGAKRMSLGVFEENPSAHYCYKSVGFREIPKEPQETYSIKGEVWKCIEMEYI